MKIDVNLGANSYSIYIENNLLSRAAEYIRTVFTGRRIMIISGTRSASTSSAAPL